MKIKLEEDEVDKYGIRAERWACSYAVVVVVISGDIKNL
jgi:hypothetical protein